MKKKFYIKAALSIMSVAMLSSCLKQSKYAVDFSTAKPLVELPGAANVSGTAGLFESVGLTSKASGTTPFNVPVNLAAVKPLSSNLTVKLSVDQAALDAYNTANGTTYLLLPASDYNSTLTTTIPAGQNLANVVVNVNTSAVDLTQTYVLPLTITDGGGQQISNYKTVLLYVQIKNQYDGTYALSGYIHRNGDLTLGGQIKSGSTTTLSTLTANSVSYTQTWNDGATPAGGINPLTLTVDPATNNVTITSTINATLTNLSGYNSHYDPASKTFYLGLIWNGSDPNYRSAIDTLVAQ